MRLKVISDGQFTKVVDAKTGKEVEGVTSIVWKHTAPGDFSELRMSVIDVEAEIEHTLSDTQAIDFTTLSDKFRQTFCRKYPPST